MRNATAGPTSMSACCGKAGRPKPRSVTKAPIIGWRTRSPGSSRCRSRIYLSISADLPTSPSNSPPSTRTSMPSGARRWSRRATPSHGSARPACGRAARRTASASVCRCARCWPPPRRRPGSGPTGSSSASATCEATRPSGPTPSRKASAPSACWTRPPAARCATSGYGRRLPPPSAPAPTPPPWSARRNRWRNRCSNTMRSGSRPS